MAKLLLNNSSLYQGCCFVLPTKHAKSTALIRPLWDILGASVIELAVDTDIFGTFTGEIPRKTSALDSARAKCELVIDMLGDRAEYVLASEGSYGPHPSMPFLACANEILYFIDRRRGFHLHVSSSSTETNFLSQDILTYEDLCCFVNKVKFPSHAVILKSKEHALIFKGIDSWEELSSKFYELKKVSNFIQVETDMRAYVNPTRMNMISELASNLALRLKSECPACSLPGWGRVSYEYGLACEACNEETNLIKSEVWGCVKCSYKQIIGREDGLHFANPKYCNFCNP